MHPDRRSCSISLVLSAGWPLVAISGPAGAFGLASTSKSQLSSGTGGGWPFGWRGSGGCKGVVEVRRGALVWGREVGRCAGTYDSDI